MKTVKWELFVSKQDKNSHDSKIRIQLISLPMYGVLTKAKLGQAAEELSEFSFFTMEDINSRKIK